MDRRNFSYHGDKPIGSFGEDLLGFGDAARLVARSIHSMSSPDGFVIGIEGDWGAGKSSFINLVVAAISEEDSPAEVISFLPWLISSREGLLHELFSEILNASINIVTPSRASTVLGRVLQVLSRPGYLARWRRASRIKRLYSKFSGRVVQAARLADIGFSGGAAGAAVHVGKEFVDSWLDTDSLADEKAKLSRELANLDRKIVVLIDDLDRLEPQEVVEVLRLVRAVVDFPNIVFVLCYSRAVVAKSLESALQLADGDDFLGKIVQVSYPIPRPQSFDLRRMLRAEIMNYFSEVLAVSDVGGMGVHDRLERVIDFEGGLGLSTPRHVVRAINALRFYGGHIAGQVDIADLVWLQLIRLQSHDLFKWVEYYLVEFSALNAGAGIQDAQKQADEDALRAILNSMQPGASVAGRLSMLAEILPGVKARSNVNGRPGEMVLSLYETDGVVSGRNGRLSSLHHHRLYFAFSAPHGAISDYELEGLIESSRLNLKGGVQKMLSLATRKDSGGGGGISMLIDRIEGAVESLPDDALSGLIYALADVMHVFSGPEHESGFGINSVWHDGEMLFATLWGRATPAARAVLVTQIFGGVSSIEWLVNIFRREVFAHGIYGDRSESEGNWIFSAAELDCAGSELISRFRGMGVSEIETIDRLLPFLYALVQFDPGVTNEVREKLKEWVDSDYGLLHVLERMRGWRSSNGVVTRPLYEEHVERFMDLELVKRKLTNLTKTRPDSRARNLLAAMVKEKDE